MDTIEIFQDLVVPKPQNAITLVLHERSSRGFAARRAVVLAAVDFHYQPGLVAHKIGNVGADWHLATEFVPLHLMRAQYLPHAALRLGHVLP